MKWKTRLKVYWPLLLPLLLLLPGMSGFPYPSPDAKYSDISLTFYPNLLLIQRSLIEHFTVPLWSPLILSGAPFAANPQSGIMYPFGWLALLLPLPLGINLMVMLHLLWGGIGMVTFLRQQGRTPQAALIGGLAFSAMPKLYAHYGTGHLAFMYAIPWIPWLLWAASGNQKHWYTQPGMILAAIFLASPMWAVFSGLLWLSWEAMNWWASTKGDPTLDDNQSNPGICQKFKHLLLQVFLAMLLSSPLLLPLVQYTALSTRSYMTTENRLENSLTPVQLFGLLFPDFGGHHEHIVYPGVVVLCLALAAALLAFHKRKVRYWLALVILCLLYSLGSNMPGVPWLMSLPGMSLLRIPTRTLFLAGIGWSALAAYGFDQLQVVNERRYTLRLFLAGLLAFCLVFGIAVWFVKGQMPLYIFYGAGGFVLFWVWVETRKSNRLLPGLLVALVVLDLVLVDRTLFSLRPSNQVLEEGSRVAWVMSSEPGRFRIYSPSYSIPQQTAALYGLELADGVDPLQLKSYAEFMVKASGVPSVVYTETQPPYASGDPTVDNQDYLPDIRLLSELGVRFVVSAFPLDIQAQQVSQIGEDWVYRLNGAPMPEMPSPNERIWQVQGGETVKIPEVNYPGWRATVDGQPAELVTIDGLFQGVDLPAGSHEVKLVFHSQALYWGLGLWALGVAILVFLQRKRSLGE